MPRKQKILSPKLSLPMDMRSQCRQMWRMWGMSNVSGFILQREDRSANRLHNQTCPPGTHRSGGRYRQCGVIPG
ncbi:hypothetical protein [Nostoc sp.]|uniref:hypothetical protein n=1 Tax=Nostoc sp. TaxID=1180 RepID=UPI002FF67514